MVQEGFPFALYKNQGSPPIQTHLIEQENQRKTRGPPILDKPIWVLFEARVPFSGWFRGNQKKDPPFSGIHYFDTSILLRKELSALFLASSQAHTGGHKWTLGGVGSYI